MNQSTTYPYAPFNYYYSMNQFQTGNQGMNPMNPMMGGMGMGGLENQGYNYDVKNLKK